MEIGMYDEQFLTMKYRCVSRVLGVCRTRFPMATKFLEKRGWNYFHSFHAIQMTIGTQDVLKV